MCLYFKSRLRLLITGSNGVASTTPSTMWPQPRLDDGRGGSNKIRCKEELDMHRGHPS